MPERGPGPLSGAGLRPAADKGPGPLSQQTRDPVPFCKTRRPTAKREKGLVPVGTRPLVSGAGAAQGKFGGGGTTETSKSSGACLSTNFMRARTASSKTSWLHWACGKAGFSLFSSRKTSLQ